VLAWLCRHDDNWRRWRSIHVPLILKPTWKRRKNGLEVIDNEINIETWFGTWEENGSTIALLVTKLSLVLLTSWISLLNNHTSSVDWTKDEARKKFRTGWTKVYGDLTLLRSLTIDKYIIAWSYLILKTTIRWNS
jgi:hypothetical protein